jgi:hypothetical protein
MSDIKIYLNTFSSVKRNEYGTKVYIKSIDALYAELKANANDDGSIRINLSNRQTADKFGNNAYAALDTWKPSGNYNPSNNTPNALPVQQEVQQAPAMQQGLAADLPF